MGQIELSVKYPVISQGSALLRSSDAVSVFALTLLRPLPSLEYTPACTQHPDLEGRVALSLLLILYIVAEMTRHSSLLDELFYS